MAGFAYAVVLTIVQFAVGQSPDRHMVCKDVSDIFEKGGQSRPSVPHQGRPGKIGPAGPKGEIGPRGPAGSVDYEQVREIVRQEVQEGLNNLNTRIDRLELYVNESVKSPQSSGLSEEEKVQCLEEYQGIPYNGSCLWMVQIIERVNLAEALAVCNTITPSKIPEIYGEAEYVQLMKYFQSKITATYGIAWTRMRRNHETGQAMMSDGSVAPYQKIRPSPDQWEAAEARRTNVYVQVKRDPNHADQGMGSIWPEYKANNLLCQTI